MKNRSQIFWTFIVVLLELIALGMIIPLNPYLARNYGADGLQVGLLMSIYSAVQCLASPLWGRLSDRIGKKPILLFSLAGTSLSYLWFAFAPDLPHLFYSRAMAGLCGVTISTGFALIAGITSSEKRSHSMALIGAAFGLGFVIGPAMGGILGSLQGDWDFSLVALASCLVCLLGLLIAFFTLKNQTLSTHSHNRLLLKNTKGPGALFQSMFSFLLRKKTKHSSKQDQNTPDFKKADSQTADFSKNPKENNLRITPSFFSSEFYQSLKHPRLRSALIIFFILSLSLTLVEAPLFLLMKDDLLWPQSLSSWGFAYIGVVLALTQGVLVRFLIPKKGEALLSQWGFFLLVFGFFGLCFPKIIIIAGAVTLMSLGYGLAYSCLTGAISLLSPQTSQGGVLGVHQSLSSLSRILGPAIGGWMYRDLSHQAPFLVSALLALAGLMLAFLFRKIIPSKGKI